MAIYRYRYGFSLVELMVVVAVVAILASIAYPSYQSYMTKNRRADGKIALLEIMQAQREYYLANRHYTVDLVNQLEWPHLGGSVYSEHKFYTVLASRCGSEPFTECVQLTAIAQRAQQNDGDLIYNSRNVKTPEEKWK